MADPSRPPRPSPARSIGEGGEPPEPSPSAQTADERHPPVAGSLAPPPVAPALYRDYAVTGEQGRGGLGRVLRAHDRRLGRVVAVKELLGLEPSGVARFLREARLTARLQHPSIVPVYELGFRADGAPYYAMKLVEGERLDERFSRLRSLDERLALLPSVLAVIEAMAYAHEQHIIHRDLKPSNVIVGAFGETVVIDWGLAKDLADPSAYAPAPDVESGRSSALSSEPPASVALDPTLRAVGSAGSDDRTQAGHAMGTLAYMPPEQFCGERVDERADVFALGACLYQCITARAPYVEASIVEVSRRVHDADFEPVEALEPGVPKELAAIVRKAMARDPANRYPTAKELASDLRSFQTGQLVGAHHYSRRVLAWRWIARHKQGVLGVLAFVTALAAIGSVSVARVVRERDRAEAERARADTERQRADQARVQAETRALELVLVEAKTSLDRDPTATLAWLKTYPPDGPDEHLVPSLAADAERRGVARHVLRGHKGSITLLAISPDGRLAATGGDGKSVRVWEIATGRAVGAWSWASNRLSFLDPSTLISASRDGQIATIDVPSGTLHPADRRTPDADSLDVAPDGRSFATCGQSGALLWWPGSVATPVPLAHHDAECSDLSWSPDGRRIASTWTDDTLRITDVRTHATVRTFPLTPGENETQVEWSPDGRHLAVVDPSVALRVIDLSTGGSMALEGHDGVVQSMTFMADGAHLVTGGRDATVRVWDVATGKGRVLFGHSAVVELVDASRDGTRILSCSEDTTVRVWDLASGEVRVLRGHTGTAQGCAFTPDGETAVSASADQTLRIWDVREPPQTVLRGHLHDVHVVAWSPDGSQLASGSQDSTVRVWDPRTAEARVLEGHSSAVVCLRYLGLQGKRLASASWDHTIRTWDLATGSPLRVFSHDAKVTGLASTRDGASLVSSSEDGTVRTWDADTGASTVMRGHDGAVTSVALSPDETSIASGGNDGTVRLWDRTTGAARAVLRGHTDAVSDVVFSPDGSLVASASWDDTVRVWDARLPALVRTLEGHTDRVRHLVFSPDGSRIASAGNDTTVRVWTVATGAVEVLEGHAGYVRALAFSDDGGLLASGAMDATTRVWDPRTGRLRALFRDTGAVIATRFSPDGSQLASGGWDAKVYVRGIDEASLLPVDPGGLRGWLAATTTAVVDARGELASPPTP